VRFQQRCRAGRRRDKRNIPGQAGGTAPPEPRPAGINDKDTGQGTLTSPQRWRSAQSIIRSVWPK